MSGEPPRPAMAPVTAPPTSAGGFAIAPDPGPGRAQTKRAGVTSSRATVYDVARRAGVSIKTVSRVVNSSPEVSPDTRDRVQAAMADLAYVRNTVAHALVTGSSATIGVVVDSIADRFFSTLVSAVEDLALVRGISVLIASTGRSAAHERTQIERLVQQRVGALIIAPAVGDHGFVLDTASDLPIVLVDRGWELPGFDVVRVQDTIGACEATRHLIEHGHRRIAFLGESTVLETVAARRAGYESALLEHGIALDPELISEYSPDRPAAEDVTRRLLAAPNPPTAVFASHPRAAMGVVSALHTMSRTDVALISFGDFELADSLVPAVTVIDHDPRLLAESAVTRLFARMADDHLPGIDITLPVTLIARGSGEVRP